MTNPYDSIRSRLTTLYGAAEGPAVHGRLIARLDAYRSEHPARARAAAAPAERLSERDIMLITYGDTLQAPGDGLAPLSALHRFLTERLSDVLSAVHILPFFPYSSDDGFAVIDYLAVDPRLGAWEDVQRLGADFKLMFDAVINHISARSAWFEAFRSGDPAYHDFFIVVDPDVDLSAVVRPRSLPLLTPVEMPDGTQHVWTTFSADQIDLNYANPAVLLRVIDVLLFYVAQGASFIRLDAIAYLWKIPGTSSIHLPQTHEVVKLLRDVLDAVAPQVAIITETNVPHAENVSYFGSGSDEAQLVYQFSLPPLTLHAFATADATILSRWAASLEALSAETTFFNFTASHDGIGVRPAEGILSREEVAALAAQAERHGGAVSYKTNSDGTQSPYELNINYFDALSDPASTEPRHLQAQRFIASQAIMLALAGMPGIYIHSLLGSHGWPEGVRQTGHNRSINREKLDVRAVEAALDTPGSLRQQVFDAYTHLIRQRIQQPAFHPNAPQQVLHLDPALFVLLRTDPQAGGHILAVQNVANRSVLLDLSAVPVQPNGGAYRDLVAGTVVEGGTALTVAPYQVLWLLG